MDSIAQEQTGSIEQAAPKSFVKQALRWLPFTLICLTVFTLAKLPTFQFKDMIQEKIAAQLRPMGIVLSAEESRIGFLLGLSYTLKNASITLTRARTTLKLDEITIKPKILPLLTGKIGARAILVKGKSEISLDGAANSESFNASLNLSDADLTQFGLFEIASQAVSDPFDVIGGIAKTKPQIILDGGMEFSGSLKEPNALKGSTDVQIKKIVFRSLKLPIFEIPKIEINDGKIKTNIANGKVNIETLTVGKAGSKDDLIGQATGSVDIGKSSFDSKYNLKVKFGISEELSKTFGPLLGAVLGPAKQPDGMFAYTVMGSVNRPIATPGN